MQVQKAVITAAAPRQRKLPLQTLIDKKGDEKSFLELLIEEVTAAGINDICIVIQAGDEGPYGQAIGDHLHNVTFIAQKEALGYGHALYTANEFTGRDPFLHLVGDHLYVNRGTESSAKHLVDFAGKQNVPCIHGSAYTGKPDYQFRSSRGQTDSGCKRCLPG